MKKKNIFIIASLLVIAVVIGSCTKNITLDPSSGVTIDSYFKNQKDITAGLAGIYSAFQEEMAGDGKGNDEGYGGRYNYWGDIRTDNFTASTFPGSYAVSISENSIPFTAPGTDWGGLYKVISRTNLAIKYFPQVPQYDPNVTPTILNTSLAQAYAMRAESYFYIVRVWGDAPVWTEPYLDVTQTPVKPQTKALTIIDSLIIPDLNRAYNLIQKLQTPVVWNMNEAAICAIAADVYMWRAALPGGGGTADYTNALAWDTKLLAAKTPSGTFYSGTTPSGVSNVNIGALETGSNWKNLFLTPASSPEPIWSIYWDYTVNGCACIPVSIQTSNNPYQLDPFFHSRFKTGYKTDVRVSKSIDTNNTFNHINILYKYLNRSPVAAGVPASTANTNDNVYLVMYRLADVYLQMAEAYAKTGDLTNALKYLNYVYARARYQATTPAPAPATIPATQYTTPDAMIDGILAEGSYELLGEGKRWFDLIRMGRVHQIMDPVLNFRNGTATTVGGVTTVVPDTKGFVDAPNRYYWPISQSALNANNLVHQNPGY
jgi:hypothetical protein